MIFGGSYSNYTKERVIAESPLIEVYHSCHANIERNFQLGGLTTRHTPPDMKRTYRVLAEYMEQHDTNTYQPGRKTFYSIPDVLNKGLMLLLQGDVSGQEGGANEAVNEAGEDIVEEEDVVCEL